MTIESAIILFAGLLVALSLILSVFFGPFWLLLAGSVGLGLFQAGFTGFCPCTFLFKKMGLKSKSDSYKSR